MRVLVEDFDRLPLQEKLREIQQLLTTISCVNDSSTNNTSHIAIVIATYNRISYLLTFLYSIFLQKQVNVKCYISDDASTDGTKDILKSLSHAFPSQVFYCYSTVNIGPSENRKRALRAVSEEIVVIADDDDYYINALFLYHASRALCDQQKNSSVFFGSAYIVDVVDNREIDVVIDYVGKPLREVAFNLLFSMRKPPSTFLLVFKMTPQLKGAFLSMSMFNDVAIYFALLFYYVSTKLAGTTEICGVYREHASNITKSLDFTFIVKNIDQQIELIQSAPFTDAEKSFLIRKHLNNKLQYFVDNSVMTKELRSRLLSFLSRYRYKGVLKDRIYWYFKLLRSISKN